MRQEKYTKKKKQMKMIRFSLFIILIGVIAALGINQIAAIFSDNWSHETSNPQATSQENRAQLSSSFSAETLFSPYAYLMDVSTQEVIFEQEGTKRVSPASLTKIMTAYVAIENLNDFKEYVTVPQDIFPYLYSSHASVAGFAAGESVQVIDLLYGCMLPSGADASLTLAIKIAGSEQGFVDLMNKKAQQLGLSDTHFSNVSGLYDSQHYSSARDMAILLSNALKNSQFREIFTAPQYTTASTSHNPNGLTFKSTMFARMSSPYFEDGEILGGKTGHISDAGLCLASLAERKGREFILVTMGAEGTPYTDPTHLWDAFTLYGQLYDYVPVVDSLNS